MENKITSEISQATERLGIALSEGHSAFNRLEDRIGTVLSPGNDTAKPNTPTVPTNSSHGSTLVTLADDAEALVRRLIELADRVQL